MNINDSLYGRPIPVTLKDKKTDTFTVREFLVEEYQALIPQIENEFALVARACDRDLAVILTVLPRDYEKLHTAMREVNADGFFTFVGRRMAAGQREVKLLLEAGVPLPEVMALVRGNGSSKPSPTSPQPAV